MSNPIIAWTRPKLARLKEAHAAALAAGQDEFELDLDGEVHRLHTGYAGYLAEFLDAKLPAAVRSGRPLPSGE